ncbi:MAG: hypothetical protein COT22_03730 [Ignavibacteria bacterium CG08_land_8_20_14_0_20_37_9]|nr:MAG: hypothetical protein COT22_03730 [Ignavibacteria bacterium CG08_land_8_20_14_0_20_37_9]
MCAKACPSSIKVDKVKVVVSDECTTCLSCIDACPVADTLFLQPVKTKITINNRILAFGVVGIFLIITAVGIFTGRWQNNITKEEYLLLHKNLDRIGHVSSYDELETDSSLTNIKTKNR